MSAGDWKDMFLAAGAGDVDLVRYHLQQGVDVDHVHPEFQSTVLVAAVLAGHGDVAHLLLDHGADPLHVSPLEGLTPVQAAREAGLRDVEARLRSMGAPDPTPVRPPGRGWRDRLRVRRR